MSAQSTQNPSANPSTSSAVPGTQAPDITAMANAINTLVQSNVPSRIKLGEPDTFNGSDPKKLRTFLLHCKLNFQDCPDLFPNGTAKVNYVLSYLKGSALECFKPGLLAPTAPVWTSDFDLFVEELEANFGTYDPIGKAEAELEGLRMQENYQATKYFIKFTQLAARVQWGQAALLRQAYNGLTKQIKNNMVHHDKPTTLSDLRKLIQAIDSCYWEHKAEISCENASGSSGNKSENKSDNSKTEKGKGSSKSKQKDSNLSSSSTSSKGSTSESKKSNPDLSSKLGKDGKLTPQERQCRLDKNLCLFCGASGHMAKDCPKSTSTAAKAHAASTTPAPESTLTPKSSESKKD